MNLAVGALLFILIYGSLMLALLIGAIKSLRSFITWRDKRKGSDELAVARASGVTVPPADGSHDSLPEDKETDEAFWAVAKRVGIEVDR